MAESVSKPRRNPLDAFIWWVASFFGDKAKEVDRFLKFAVVGAIGAVIDFATLNFLQHSVLVPQDPNKNVKVMIATGIAFTAAVISNYIWNKYWTFPDSHGDARKQLIQFFLISIVGLVFRLIFVSLTFLFFGNLVNSTLSGNMSDTDIAQAGSNVAQAISIGIVMLWNFFANRFWTFNDVE